MTTETALDDTLLEHVKKLEQGKQGITGLVRWNGELCVYKLSQYMNYLTSHEYLIMKGLEEVSHHFCKALGRATVRVHPNFRETNQDPFEYHKHAAEMEVLFLEYIPDSISLLDLIENPNIPTFILLSCIKQVFLAVTLAQEKKNFVHYDLHSLNILIRRCKPSTVHVYETAHRKNIQVPTFGFVPVIIDFGFSYSQDLLEHPSYLSLAYTDAGYMSPAFDPLADAKIFLVSTAEDLRECRPEDPNTKILSNIVMNLFQPLQIDWRSGWDKKKDILPIVDQIFEYVENPHETCQLFKNSSHLCMDILQSLITLPLQSRIEGTLQDLHRAYRIFVREFSKVEAHIGRRNEFHTLYVLRKIVDTARYLRDEYMDDGMRVKTLEYFKNQVFVETNKVVKFCQFRGVDFEKMLCALLMFGEQMEFQLYHRLNKRMTEKFKEYESLEIQNIEYMYGLLEFNFETKAQANPLLIYV